MQRKEEHLPASGPLPLGAHGVGQNLVGTSSQFAAPAVGSQMTPAGYGGTMPVTTSGVAQAPLYGNAMSLGQQAVYGQGNPLAQTGAGVAPMQTAPIAGGILPAAPVPGTTMAGEFGHDIPIVEPVKQKEVVKEKETVKDEKKGGFLSGLFGGGNKDKDKHSEELHVRKDISTDKAGVIKETTQTKIEKDNKTVFKDKDTKIVGQKPMAMDATSTSTSTLPLATKQTFAHDAPLAGSSFAAGSSQPLSAGATLPLSSGATSSGSSFIVRDIETTTSSSKSVSNCPVHMVGATDIAGKQCVCSTTEGFSRSSKVL